MKNHAIKLIYGSNYKLVSEEAPLCCKDNFPMLAGKASLARAWRSQDFYCMSLRRGVKHP